MIRGEADAMKNIPVLHVDGTSIAEAYERALLELNAGGIRIKTQYDKTDDPASIDATSRGPIR